MQVTQIILKKTNSNDKLKAVASLTLSDMIAIHDIKILTSQTEKKYFMGMPSKKLKDSFIDIVHPINKDVREHLEDILFDKMEVLEQSDASFVKLVYTGGSNVSFLKQNVKDFVLEGQEVTKHEETKRSIFKWFND
jgi:stage V sporulation protein G